MYPPSPCHGNGNNRFPWNTLLINEKLGTFGPGIDMKGEYTTKLINAGIQYLSPESKHYLN